ncbi:MULTISPECIES: CPBP family intramembrane glutamic endopeptidase [Niastella]|uniref:CPBP family intramembrane metalloprotease n=1 Tax=Niastella soli TaxID=2821487 RepID=A0ABS3YW69_9BACT|nr:type II CAAX endopeptidase family protein [Niastella soli]MBO9202113.1 CPBP family intramembrane metalloprotease [Niastella soli]
MKNAFLKCLLFWILFVAIIHGFGSLTALAPPSWSTCVRLLHALLVTLATFYLIRIFLKSEKRTYKDIELVWNRNTPVKFLLGVLIGTAIFALVLLVLINFTGLQLTRNANGVNWQVWFTSLLIIIPFAFIEELAFRSYTLLKLDKAYGLFWAQIGVAISFALYHIAGGWNWQVAFYGPGAWAFVFGLAAILSRGIAVPTGIHVALNFLQVVAGMKPGNASLWTLHLKQNTAAASTTANQVGVGIQITILVAGILVTYFVVQKKKRFIEIPV